MHHLALLAGLAVWAAQFAFCIPREPVPPRTLFLMGFFGGVASVVGALLLTAWFFTAIGWLRWYSADAEVLDRIDPDEPR